MGCQATYNTSKQLLQEPFFSSGYSMDSVRIADHHSHFYFWHKHTDLTSNNSISILLQVTKQLLHTKFQLHDVQIKRKDFNNFETARRN